MKNEICILVKDLLPSYIDGVCSEDSIKIIENHIGECEECKAMYESMKSDFMADEDLFAESGNAGSEEASEFETTGLAGNSAVGKDFDEGTSPSEKSGKVNSDYKYRERNIGNGSDDYDRELLKKVNEKIKKRENKFKVASLVAIAAAVVLILIMFLPIVPVRHDSMDIRVLVNNMSNYSLDEFPEAGKFEDLKDDNTIFVYDDDCVKNKAFDELTFYEVNAPILPRDTTFMVAEGFDLSKLVVVEVSSNKIIKSYSYKEKNSRLVFSHFRTSLAGLILSNDENSFTTRVVNFDGVEEVVFE